MWGRLQPAAGVSPPRTPTYLRFPGHWTHYEVDAHFTAPSPTPLCSGQPLFVTFRLHGSLPPGRDFSTESMSSGKAFVCLDQLLDHDRSSPMYLQEPSIAQYVVVAIQQGGRSTSDGRSQ